MQGGAAFATLYEEYEKTTAEAAVYSELVEYCESFTRATKSVSDVTMGWSQPCAAASSAFSRVPTVPITVAPRCLAHWQAIVPTPPAAAWIRIVSPAFTG